MKKSLIAIAIMCCSGLASQAQVSKFSYGGGLIYGPNINMPGINLRLNSEQTNKIRYTAELNAFLPYDHPNQLSIR